MFWTPRRADGFPLDPSEIELLFPSAEQQKTRRGFRPGFLRSSEL
jgi:hypothetical protein